MNQHPHNNFICYFLCKLELYAAPVPADHGASADGGDVDFPSHLNPIQKPHLFPQVLNRVRTRLSDTLSHLLPQITGPVQVARRSDVDMNQHLNNVTYLAWCLETVPLDVYTNCQLHQARTTFLFSGRILSTAPAPLWLLPPSVTSLKQNATWWPAGLRPA